MFLSCDGLAKKLLAGHLSEDDSQLGKDVSRQ